MRDADSYTIANFVDSKELMYRAGEAIFYVGDWNIGDKVLVVAGSGIMQVTDMWLQIC